MSNQEIHLSIQEQLKRLSRGTNWMRDGITDMDSGQVVKGWQEVRTVRSGAYTKDLFASLRDEIYKSSQVNKE